MEYVTPEGAAAAIAANQQQRLELSKAQLGTYSGTAKTMVVDGDIWDRMTQAKAAALGRGTVNGGTVVAVSGSTDRWVRRTRVLTPAMFGAAGDGVTDDSTALENAVNALNPGDTLDLGGRSYLVKRGILLLLRNKPRVVIEGVGATISIDPAARRDYWTALFQPLESNGLIIRDLTIECNVPYNVDVDTSSGVTGTDGYIQRGIYVSNCTGVRIENVTVTNPRMDGIRIDASTADNLVTGCIVRHRGGFKRDAGGNDIFSDLIQIPRYGILVVSSMASSGGYSGDTNALGTNLERTADSKPADALRNVIRNCSTTGTTHGIALLNAAYSVVEGNFVSDSSHRGIALGPTSEHNVITSNRVTRVGSTGIHLANGSHWNTITGNTVDTVHGNEGDGIKCYVGCRHNTISGNVVRGAYWTGIRLAWAACYNVVSGNTVVMRGQGVVGTVGIGVVSRTYAQAAAFAVLATPPVVGSSYLNVITGNTVASADTAIRLGEEFMQASYAAASSSLSEVRGNVIQGNTARECTTGLSMVDRRETHTGTAHSSTGYLNSGYITGNVVTDLRLLGVTNTADGGTVPAVAFFEGIRGVTHAGKGFGPVQLVQRDAQRTTWQASGAPGASGAYANGDTYIDTATGERYHMIGGGWKKSTVA